MAWIAAVLCLSLATGLQPQAAPRGACNRRSCFGLALATTIGVPTGAAFAFASPGSDGDDIGDVDQAFFSGGDPRVLAPAFDAVRGVFTAETGKMTDGTLCLRVTYDPTTVSYGRLLGQYWRAVDPTVPAAEGQFGDTGAAFRTAIWPTTKREAAIARTSRQRLDELGLFGERRVLTDVVALPFSGAQAYGFVEDAKQDWAKGNKDEFAKKLESSGRSAFFEATYQDKAMFKSEDPWPAGSFSSLK